MKRGATSHGIEGNRLRCSEVHPATVRLACMFLALSVASAGAWLFLSPALPTFKHSARSGAPLPSPQASSRSPQAARSPILAQLANHNLGSLPAEITTEDCASLFHYLNETEAPPADTSHLLASLFRRWAELDPASAAQACQSLRNQSLRRENLARVASVWAENDSPAARAWASALPAPVDRKLAASSVADAALDTHPDLALSIAAQLYAETGDDTTLITLSSRFSSQDPLAARAWLDAMPEGGTRDHLLHQQALQWANENPVFAAGLAAELGAPDQRAAALKAVLGPWHAREPHAAAEWVAHLPEGSLRTDSNTALLASSAVNSSSP